MSCGCGTGPMIELLHEKYPDKHYTGLDLTPEMIHVAQAKNLSNTEFLVGDSENLPFEDDSFDAVICANSFHHYPNPQDFFNSTYRVFLQLCCLAYESSGNAPGKSVRTRRCKDTQTCRIRRHGRKSRLHRTDYGKAERLPRTSCCEEMIYIFPRKSRITFT